MGSQVPPYPPAQALGQLEMALQQCWKTPAQRKTRQFTGSELQLIGLRSARVASNGGEAFVASLGRCRPPEAGQPLASEQQSASSSLQKKQMKTPALCITSWKVCTVCSGLSADLRQMDDCHKTAIINKELARLNIDIACLQETRLADSGFLRERHHLWQDVPGQA